MYIIRLRRICQRYKSRIIWYDQCLLEITSYDFFGKINYDNNFCMSNVKKLGDKFTFTSVCNTLMDNNTTLATSNVHYTEPTALFYVGETRFKGDTLYGMVQCTRDLSPHAWQECIVFKIARMITRSEICRQEARSCTFRFEFYPFITKPVQNI